MIKYEDFCKVFCELEKRENLFALEFNGVKYWKYARYIMFEFLGRKLFGLAGTSWLNPENKMKNSKYKHNYQKYTDVFFHNINFTPRKDVMMFTFPRRVKYNNKYVSPVTDEIVLHSKRSMCVVETPYYEGYYRPTPIRGIKYFNPWEGVLDEKKVYTPINRGELRKQLLQIFENEFDIQFTVQEKKEFLLNINRCIMFRDELMARYKKIISKVNPKVVLYTMSYINEWVVLTETLKEMNIPGIEILHGYVDNTCVAYNYAEIGLNDSLPDYIFAYSQVQKDTLNWGISKECIRVVGNPWLEKRKKEFLATKDIQGEKKQILFISSTAQSIEKYIVYLADKIDQNKYEIIFKLHPEEYGCWKTIYKKLPDGVEVVDNGENDIHYYLARADFVIGITSTALFEAAIYSAWIIVLEEESWQSMGILLKAGGAVLIHDVQELFSYITSDSARKTKKVACFYAENAIENINNEIEKIITEREKGC